MGFDGGVEGTDRFGVLRTAQKEVGQVGRAVVIHFSTRQNEGTEIQGITGYKKRNRKARRV